MRSGAGSIGCRPSSDRSCGRRTTAKRRPYSVSGRYAPDIGEYDGGMADRPVRMARPADVSWRGAIGQAARLFASNLVFEICRNINTLLDIPRRNCRVSEPRTSASFW